MDQPTGNPKDIFDAIVAQVELAEAVREFDNADHSGDQNTPTEQQLADAAHVLAKARELRRLLGR